MKLIEDMRTIVKICSLYYQSDVSQKEISMQLGISRPQISRALSYARQEGIVSIKINNPFAEENKYEVKLVEQFGLRRALAVDAKGLSDYETNDKLAHSASVMLNDCFSGQRTIGIMSGKSIMNSVKYMGVGQGKSLRFVPLVGGMGEAGADWHANFITRALAEKTGGKSYVLSAPLMVQSPQAKEALEGELHIKNVLALAGKCDVMLLGVAQINENATLVRSGAMTDEYISLLREAGAAAAVGADFLDSGGVPIRNDITRRFIGVKADVIRTCPRVIVVAYGAEKADAIMATLKSGLVQELVTTLDTAKCLLDE